MCIIQRLLYPLLLLTVSTITAFSQDQPDPPLPPFEKPAPPAEVFKVVENMPMFPGCDENMKYKEREACAKEKMLDYIYAELKYPEDALLNGIEGMAVVQFIIDTTGFIIKSKVVRKPSNSIADEALRIVENMNNLSERWIPGKQRGRKTLVQYTLPIKFKIEGNSKWDSGKRRRKRDCYPTSMLWEQPRFEGCENARGYDCTKRVLNEFIEDNRIYPEEAIEQKIEGIVTVRFEIDNEGWVNQIGIVGFSNPILEKDAMGIVEWMNEEGPAWTPGEIDYKAVCSRYELDVEYKLDK